MGDLYQSIGKRISCRLVKMGCQNIFFWRVRAKIRKNREVSRSIFSRFSRFSRFSGLAYLRGLLRPKNPKIRKKKISPKSPQMGSKWFFRIFRIFFFLVPLLAPILEGPM